MAGKKDRNALPTVTSSLAPDMRRFVNRVREVIGEGQTIIQRDDVVQELPFTALDDGSITVTDLRLEQCPLVPPAPPSQSDDTDPFEARGAFENVILTWGGLPYGSSRCHDFTEIWRTATPVNGSPDIGDFSTATLIGTTTGRTYADPVGPGSKVWYWIRFVDYRGEIGPYQDQVGLLAETAPDLDYILDVLTSEYGLGTLEPFFFVPDCELLTQQAIINGEPVPPCEEVWIGGEFDENGNPVIDPETGQARGAVKLDPGVYIKEAFIGEATITDAKIRDLAVDKLFAASGTIADAVIGDGHINNAMIGNIIASDDYDPNGGGPTSATWYINKSGKALFRDIEIRDIDGNVIFASRGEYDAETGQYLPLMRSEFITGLGSFANLDQITSDNISTFIANGAIDNAYIGTLIQSEDFIEPGAAGGPRGWRISKGDPEGGVSSDLTIANGTFYGELNIIGSGDNRTEITNDGIRVLVEGQERVRIGKLF